MELKRYLDVVVIGSPYSNEAQLGNDVRNEVPRIYPGWEIHVRAWAHFNIACQYLIKLRSDPRRYVGAVYLTNDADFSQSELDAGSKQLAGILPTFNPPVLVGFGVTLFRDLLRQTFSMHGVETFTGTLKDTLRARWKMRGDSGHQLKLAQ